MAVQHHLQDPWTRVRTIHDFPADEVISATQKEIRRGNLENAALLAYEMLTTSVEMEEYLWGRLQVISVEDVGYGNLNAPVLIETLYQMHFRIPRPRGDRYLFALHAVRVLCQSQKERGTDDLNNWITTAVEQNGVLPVIPDYAIDMHTRRGQEMGRDYRHFLTEASRVLPELPDRDRTYLDRLIAALDEK
ncbi:MAG: AAA family ATPase [Chloroflexi bacterium]|nr:AAA family ATPase [Chloroflexota bacterium]MCC6892632.1 AAA family ATPase [Anaerolineae bacterium]